MKHFFYILAMVAAVFGVTGCQSAGEKPVTAARLEIGAPFESVAYQVKDGVCTMREVGHDGRLLAESERKLTPAEEAAFWTELDHLQVRQWRRDYGVAVDESGGPVTHWRLVTKRGKQATASQGAGAFPGDDKPDSVAAPETSVRFQSVYGLFQKTMETKPTTQAITGGLVGR